MAPQQRPRSITAKELTGAVEDAVRRVQYRHKIEFESGIRIGPGLIIGRQIRDRVNLDQAEEIAAQITEGLTTAGGVIGGSSIKPAALVIDRRIIVGFFPVDIDFQL